MTAAQPSVMVVSPDYPPDTGGIQLLAERLVTGFRHVDPVLVTRGMARSPGRFARSLGVARGPMGHRLDMVRLNEAAMTHALRTRPAVLLNLHIVTAPAARALALAGTPYVQYLYGEEVTARPNLAAMAVRGAARTIAISRYGEGLAFSAGSSPASTHLIHPGVDLPVVDECGGRAGRPTVLTVARIRDSYKGHDVLIDAMAVVKQRVPDVQWIVIGDGPLRAALERKAKQRLDGTARFLGQVPDCERDQWYRAATVFAMPSRMRADGGGEGFGIVFLEAAAYKLPVVAGRVAGAADAVLHGESGLLVDPNRPDDVAAAIERCLTDRRLAARLGTGGRLVAEAHGWSKTTRAVEDVLLDAIEKRGKRPGSLRLSPASGRVAKPTNSEPRRAALPAARPLEWTAPIFRRHPNGRLAKAVGFRILQRRIGGHATIRRATLPTSGSILVDLADWTGAWTYYFGSDRDTTWLHEPQTVRFVRRWLRPGDSVVDVGANVGYFSFIAATIVGQSGRVDTFEPVPQLFRLLRASIALNGFDNVVHANQLAVSDTVGSARFAVSGDPANCGLGSLAGDEAPGDRTIGVDTTTLDAYVRREQLARARLLKIDVEGGELAVLRGAQSYLSQTAPDAIVCEFNPYLFGTQASDRWETILGELRSAGYVRRVVANDGGIGDIDTRYPPRDGANIFFFRRSGQ